MMTPTNAIIFLADQRGVSQLDWFRSYHSFNFGAYQAENRAPFGALRVLNDDTLDYERSLEMAIDQATDVVLIPLVGALEYDNSLGQTGFVEAGQVQVFSAKEGMRYKVTNPYPDHLVNFLQIWLKRPPEDFTPKTEINTFDFSQKNQLLPLFNACVPGFIGRYDGRAEDVYQVQSAGKGVYVFVIEGAFEVQNRLLHARDGLSLSSATEVEFEALSNDAMLLILET